MTHWMGSKECLINIVYLSSALALLIWSASMSIGLWCPLNVLKKKSIISHIMLQVYCNDLQILLPWHFNRLARSIDIIFKTLWDINFYVYSLDMKEIWMKLIEYCQGTPRRWDNNDYKLLVCTLQMGSGDFYWYHFQNIVRHKFLCLFTRFEGDWDKIDWV
jgi:hypothetical protein